MAAEPNAKIEALVRRISSSKDKKLMKLKGIMYDDKQAIFELRGRSTWNKECVKIMGLGNELGMGKPGSKCVFIIDGDTTFFVNVPDTGATFANTEDDVIEILSDMIK